MSTIPAELAELYEHALPVHAPGAWIRAAIEAMAATDDDEAS